MADDRVAETFDASDPVAVNNAKREESRRAREDADVLRKLMHTKPGRAWLYRFLASCHIYGSTLPAKRHTSAPSVRAKRTSARG